MRTLVALIAVLLLISVLLFTLIYFWPQPQAVPSTFTTVGVK